MCDLLSCNVWNFFLSIRNFLKDNPVFYRNVYSAFHDIQVNVIYLKY